MQEEDKTTKKGKKTKKKTHALRWKGTMAGRPPLIRNVVAALIAIASASLTFVELGFVGLGLDGQFSAYIVVLLLPVALAALLLGTLWGTLVAFLAGTVLLVHAYTMPLDYYELTFVTPLTSIGLFTVCGFLLGVMFAFALRNDPKRPRRIIYIGIVCLIVSLLFSIGFVVNVFVTLVVDMINDLAPVGEAGATPEAIAAINNDVARTAFRMGDVSMQVWADALLMLVVCSLGDFVAEKVRKLEGTAGLRAVFGTWLLVVVSMAFMVTSAIGFVIITEDAKNDAEQTMKSEVNYLKTQFEAAYERIESLTDLLRSLGVDYENMDDDDFEKLLNAVTLDKILDGYTVKEDGTFIVAYPEQEPVGDVTIEMGANVVSLSNDERFVEGALIKDLVSDEVDEAIDASMATGKMIRTVDDGKTDAAIEELIGGAVTTHIVYIYADRVEDNVIVAMQPAGMVFSNRSNTMGWVSLTSLVLLLVVFVITFRLLSSTVARFIDQTNNALDQITQGNLDVRVDVHDTREFESLSTGINTTVDALKGWIAEAETRMDAELATAQAIQESALPSIFPPFPDIQRFDIYASMNAAREVGGDFYDFFLIGDGCNDHAGKLGFVIADVSGKGVPAALFMMKAKTQIHDYLESGMELGEAVTEANRQLCAGNTEDMFVTAWVGVLDYATWHVDYVNAGHNPPLLWQRDGGWQWMRKKSGPMLGVFEVSYRAHSVDCLPGDTLLLYTDGVTEAFDVNEKLYGEDRLMAVVEKCYRQHPRELLESVRDDVAAWAEGAEQSDDITMLALEIGVPPEVTATLVVPADIEQLDRVNEFLHSELDRRLCPKRAQNQLDIAVEELFVNVCRYAYAQAAPEVPRIVRVQRTYSAEPPSVVVDIIDDGIAFDPLAKPDAVTPKNIEDVPIGGLGILMAKRCTDEMSYERVDGSNIVTIVKKW